ncbi:hypothetical protein [Methylobacterium sp. A54F]
MSARGAYPGFRRGLAGAAALLIAGVVPALAQPSPMNVNDCTLLPDPGALRRCLDQTEGRVQAPAAPVADPATGGRTQAAAPAEAGSAAPATAQRRPDFLQGAGPRARNPEAGRANIIDLR